MLQVSDAVVNAIEQLEPTMEAIYQAQTAAGQTRWNEHLAVDLRLAGKKMAIADVGEAAVLISTAADSATTFVALYRHLNYCSCLQWSG